MNDERAPPWRALPVPAPLVRDGAIAWASDALAERLGRTADALAGQPLGVLFPHEALRRLARAMGGDVGSSRRVRVTLNGPAGPGSLDLVVRVVGAAEAWAVGAPVPDVPRTEDTIDD